MRLLARLRSVPFEPRKVLIAPLHHPPEGVNVKVRTLHSTERTREYMVRDDGVMLHLLRTHSSWRLRQLLRQSRSRHRHDVVLVLEMPDLRLQHGELRLRCIRWTDAHLVGVGIYKCTGVSGNGQRNFALSKITNENTLLYYLDDDNIIHPNLYNLLNNINNNTIYSFNQYNRIKGGNPNIGYIDTAMVLIPFNLCKNIIWKLDIYEADGHYIKDCIDSNRDKHVYIDEDLCYYNFLK